jgi:hypothetical protein
MRTLPTRIITIYIFAFVFLLSVRPLSDPDFWWHLKTGEYIINTGLIPNTDFYSFTKAGAEWVTHEWLSEAVFYLIYSQIGFGGLMLIFAALTTLAFWLTFKRFNAHPLVGGFAVILGAWATLPTIGVRPRVFTLLLASIYLVILERQSRGGRGADVWWLIPLMALWVNLHGGFVLGFALLVLAIVGIIIDHWLCGESLRRAWPQVQTLGVVLLGCLAVALFNPSGPRIYTFPFEIFLSPIQQQTVNDWLSPNFHAPGWRPLAFLVLATITGLALSQKKVRPSDLLVFLAVTYMTFNSKRHVAILALVAIPLLGGTIQSWLASTPLARFVVSDELCRGHRYDFILTLFLLLPLTLFTPMLVSALTAAPAQHQVNVPVKAVEYMKANEITGNTFTEPNTWGGYLIWALPSNPVYIDGRIDMYGDEFVSEYLDVTSGVTDWRPIFDRHRVRVAVLRRKKFLARELSGSPEWEKVFEDEMAVIVIKK